MKRDEKVEWGGSAYGEDDVGSVADVLDRGRRDVDDYEIL